jgi:hypothetical protein
MARKTTRSYASFLRAYGNDRPDLGFDLGELVQPVVVIDDTSRIARRLTAPVIIARLVEASAGAGIWSMGSYLAGPYGATVLHIHWDAAGRMYFFDDGTDGITTVTAVQDPACNLRNVAPILGRLREGTHNADPNPATDLLTFAAGDEINVPIPLPAGCAISFSGSAANQQCSIGRLVIVEGTDG